jgi:hypothetical protein
MQTITRPAGSQKWRPCRLARTRPARLATADPPSQRFLSIRTEVGLMSGWYIGLGVLYLVLLFTLAIMTFRKGHWVLGLIGFIFPILWIIGAILPAHRRRY